MCRISHTSSMYRVEKLLTEATGDITLLTCKGFSKWLHVPPVTNMANQKTTS